MLKKLVVIGATLALLGGIAGCEDAAKSLKHFQSSTVGLTRIVTLYNCDGTVIKTWSGRFKVEIIGGTASFIVDGKEVKVSGIFTVEEM